MDCSKVGNLIYTLRTEKGMTQKALANAMNISDRTISKWERGAGCPDVSLLRELSDILGVNIEKILLGDLEPNKKDGGNMKRIKFYVCPVCGNVISSTGMAEISCCGRKLNALKARPADLSHSVSVKAVEGDYYITLEHDMEKQHYITFMAYAVYDSVLLMKLYPEQAAQVRFPRSGHGVLYICCNSHGLFSVSL